MKRPVQNAHGAILVMASFILVILIGVAALALDLGRLFVLHTEMQNAVDAAVISAATELDGEAGAIDDAKTAANQEMLNHLSHFSNKQELLESLDTQGLLFTFYTWIGSNMDSPNRPSDCNPDDSDDPDSKCLATGDDDASYVRITLDPELFSSDDGRYEIELYFLPVLSVFGTDTAATASTRVIALAGSHYEVCNYPPMMICDPAEGGDPLSPGDMVDLKEQKDPSKLWGPGFFGWLIPSEENSQDPGDGGLSGNRLLARRLGSKYGQRCDSPIVEPNPGNKGNWPRWALNTRFGLYQHGFFRSNKDDYPSAPNIIDYPRDDNIHPVQSPPGNRFGNGEWIVTEAGYEDRPSVFSTIDYNTHFHEGAANPAMITRHEYYIWEMAGNLAVNKFPGPLHAEETQCVELGSHTQECRMLNGQPFPGAAQDPTDEFKRRELFVAVVACQANGIKGGTKPFDMNDVDGKWMKFLMTEHVPPPAAGEGIKVVAEFIKEVEQKDDEHFKTVIQLYE